jgi:excinuclease UvrABC nuclease subunit
MATNQTQTCVWTGHSGRTYTFYVYPRGTKFDPGQPGLYIHTKPTPQGWVPVYIGQSKDINDRLTDKYKRASVDREGATHVHVSVFTGGEQVRLGVEEDLIARWQPVCNVQHIR